MLLAGIFIAISTVLMFAIPSKNEIVQLVWIAIAYNLYYSVAYPLYSASNSLMIPLSTRNGKQRGLLSTVSNLAGTAAGSFATLIVPMFMAFIGTNKSVWLIFMSVMAAVSLLSVCLQYFYTRERITEENIKLQIAENKVSLKKQLKALLTNKYWVVIIVFFFVFQLVGAMQNFSMVYYCNYVLGTYNDGFTQSILGIVTGIPLIAAMVFVWPLANKFGKKNCVFVGLIVSALGCLMALVAPRSWGWVIAGLCIKSLGAAPAIYIMFALIADVLDHVEAKNGFRCDGLSVSVTGIMMSVLLSICQGVFNGLISATGYLVPSKITGAFVQNAATQNVFVWCYIGVMMVGYLICALLILLLNVEKHIESDHQKIVERQKEAVLLSGGTWIEPAERLRLEQQEADEMAEQARIKELKLHCQRKNICFEDEEQKYQQKLQIKKGKAAARRKKLGKTDDNDF